MAAFEQHSLPFDHDPGQEDGTETGYDSDVIDPELEASLYAKIFHRELLWYQNDDGQSTSGQQENREETMETERSKKRAAPEDSIRTEQGSRKKRSIFVDDVDDDDEEQDGGSGKMDELPVELTITSNVAGLEESLRQRKRLEKHKDRNRRRFLRTPQSEWSAKFMIAEIQQFLAGFDDDWQISQEDSGRSIFGDRYYDKKSQGIQCRRCRECGHRARECTTKLPISCNFCGGPHIQRRCKEPLVCILCFRQGHTSEACGKINGMRPINVTCTRCNQFGHHVTVCPDQWRQFHSTISTEAAFPLKKHGLLTNAEQRMKAAYCYNCGRGGHYGHQCRKPAPFGGLLVCFDPSVSVYDKSIDSSLNGLRKSASAPQLKGNGKTAKHWRFESDDETANDSSRFNGRKSKYRKFDFDDPSANRSPSKFRNGRSNFDRLMPQINSPSRNANAGSRKESQASAETPPKVKGSAQLASAGDDKSMRATNGRQRRHKRRNAAEREARRKEEEISRTIETLPISNTKPSAEELDLLTNLGRVISNGCQDNVHAENGRDMGSRVKGNNRACRAVALEKTAEELNEWEKGSKKKKPKIKKEKKKNRGVNSAEANEITVSEAWSHLNDSVEIVEEIKSSNRNPKSAKSTVKESASSSASSSWKGPADNNNSFSWDQNGASNDQSRRSAWF